jgi:hypothetical protein
VVEDYQPEEMRKKRDADFANNGAPDKDGPTTANTAAVVDDGIKVEDVL